ncbi:uncharacterized protein LOC132757779 [Ruditapes philippinarum]|uniref:uncharacterized protein LOC132757779 n=1 Tax=Ruditapes philippinarum TaxID=129788 RepID=UPI00295B3B45|nr:uncharacterized protein LOC132757779 [Ruditapes philippinarum]
MEMEPLLTQTRKSNGDVSQEPEDDDMSDLRSTENHSQDMPESKDGEYSFTTQADIHPVPHVIVFKKDENKDMCTRNFTGTCPHKDTDVYEIDTEVEKLAKNEHGQEKIRVVNGEEELFTEKIPIIDHNKVPDLSKNGDEEFKLAKEYTATGPVKFPVASENDRKESYSNNLKVRSRQILPVVQEINEKGDCSTEQPIEIGRHKEQDAHINHMIKDVSEKVINDKIKNVSEKGLHITNPQNVEDLLTNDKTENMPTDETTAKKDMNYSDHQIPNVLKTDKTVDLPKHPHEVENNDTEKILVARKCGGINHHSSRNVMNVEEENMPSPNTQSGFKNVGTGLEKESKIQTQIYEARKS